VKCPKYRFGNRKGARFYNECGHKFEDASPECGATNQVRTKFKLEANSAIGVVMI